MEQKSKKVNISNKIYNFLDILKRNFTAIVFGQCLNDIIILIVTYCKPYSAQSSGVDIMYKKIFDILDILLFIYAAWLLIKRDKENSKDKG